MPAASLAATTAARSAAGATRHYASSAPASSAEHSLLHAPLLCHALALSAACRRWAGGDGGTRLRNCAARRDGERHLRASRARHRLLSGNAACALPGSISTAIFCGRKRASVARRTGIHWRMPSSRNFDGRLELFAMWRAGRAISLLCARVAAAAFFEPRATCRCLPPLPPPPGSLSLTPFCVHSPRGAVRFHW